MCIESLLHFFKLGNKGRGRGAPLGRGKEQVTSSKGRGRYSGGRKYKLPFFPKAICSYEFSLFLLLILHTGIIEERSMPPKKP